MQKVSLSRHQKRIFSKKRYQGNSITYLMGKIAVEIGTTFILCMLLVLINIQIL